MAYEDSSSHPQKSQPNHHNQPDPRFLQPNSHQPYSATQSMPDLEPTRSRGSSSARQDGYTSDSSRYSQRTKPINEAINSAFTATNAADSGIPPELLERLTSQITANVIRELKSNSTPSASSNTSHPADNNSSTAGSPPMGRASVYTPPSPNRPADEFPQPSHRKSFTGSQSYGRSTPPPERSATSPLSQSEHADDSDAREDRPSRPKGPQRLSTGGDITVLEKIWGKLFNVQGEPTTRLGQFLRGIAVHLIEDYEPKHSLVITPPKMQQYYQNTKVTSEIYPWQVVFDDRTSSISRMLRELEAQHHLVQDKVSERPDIPCLTPQGFETWATLLIKAHPEQEFERLAKTAMNMPISNPDDKRERFPKEISRRLFPQHADDTVTAKLQNAMSVHCNVTFRTRTESSAGAEIRDDDATPQAASKSSQDNSDRAEPTITPVTSYASSSSNSNSQREQKPQSFSSETTGVFVESDEENAPTPQPIERERKPYVAHVGGGKNYDSFDQSGIAEVKPAASTFDMKPPPPQESKLGRSQSMRSQEYNRPRPTPISVHQPANSATPIDIPESRHHRHSVYRRDGPSTSAPRRTRSPSISNEPSSSRTLDADSFSNHYGPSSSVSNPDAYDRDRRYRDYEARRERFPDDRYDAARMAAYDPRDRDRDRDRVDVRPRGQSATVGFESVKAEEEYYRNSAGYPPPPVQPHSASQVRDSGHVNYPSSSMPPPSGAHYPPSAYREGR